MAAKLRVAIIYWHHQVAAPFLIDKLQVHFRDLFQIYNSYCLYHIICVIQMPKENISSQYFPDRLITAISTSAAK